MRAFGTARRFARHRPWIVFVFHADNFLEYRHPPSESAGGPRLDLPTLDRILGALANLREDLAAVTLAEGVRRARCAPDCWSTEALRWLAGVSRRLNAARPRNFLLRGPRWGGLGALTTATLLDAFGATGQG